MQFKNVSSFEELKKQYKVLLKKNHPDNGGDVKIMQEINAEYDALFKIWKDRHETATGETVTETAESTRRKFYTEFGWEGSRHDWNRSLKEIAKIVRTYVKEKYPTYKFSVRTKYASMCQELLVEMQESPIEIYKTYDELTEDDKMDLLRTFNRNCLWKLDSWSKAEQKAEFERIWNEKGNFYKCLNEATKAVINDVDAFVASYNYEDCDGQIDYFHVDFYYFGCARNNGRDIKIVPRTARIKNNSSEVKKREKGRDQEQTPEIAVNAGYTYKVSKGEDTRDGSDLWIVRIMENLSREEYIAENKAMREKGAYYSKYLHGFIFRCDPSEMLC